MTVRILKLVEGHRLLFLDSLTAVTYLSVVFELLLGLTRSQILHPFDFAVLFNLVERSFNDLISSIFIVITCIVAEVVILANIILVRSHTSAYRPSI